MTYIRFMQFIIWSSHYQTSHLQRLFYYYLLCVCVQCLPGYDIITTSGKLEQTEITIPMGVSFNSVLPQNQSKCDIFQDTHRLNPLQSDLFPVFHHYSPFDVFKSVQLVVNVSSQVIDQFPFNSDRLLYVQQRCIHFPSNDTQEAREKANKNTKLHLRKWAVRSLPRQIHQF